MITTHATCIAFDGRGVLIRGPSGSGKSDLALRAIDQGALLVADDRVALVRHGDHIIASCPPSLFGMIEIRGLGIMRVAAAADARIFLVADLVESSAVERIPDQRRYDLGGVSVPCLALAPFEVSALAKLRFALVAAVEPERLVT